MKNNQIKKDFVSEIDLFLLEMTKEKSSQQNPAVISEVKKHKRLAKMRDKVRMPKSE